MDTITETPTGPLKPKRPYKRRAKATKAAEPAPKPKTSELAGLSITDCCDGCNADKCVITGINVCGHPAKGGLQSGQMGNMEVVKRFNRAKALLGEQKIRAG